MLFGFAAFGASIMVQQLVNSSINSRRKSIQAQPHSSSCTANPRARNTPQALQYTTPGKLGAHTFSTC